MKQLFISIVISISMIACGSDDNNDFTNNNDNNNTYYSSSGIAQLGYISNGKVELFDILDSDLPIATTFTSESLDTESAGTFTFNNLNISIDNYYVIKVCGGEDLDPNDTGIIDESNKIQNFGCFFGLFKGNELIDHVFRVTSISDILYRSIKHLIISKNNDEIEFIRNKAIQSLIKDINNDGNISMKDLLAFDPVNNYTFVNYPYESILNDYVAHIHNNSDQKIIERQTLFVRNIEILTPNKLIQEIPFLLEADIILPESIEAKWFINNIEKDTINEQILEEGNYFIEATIYQDDEYIGKVNKTINAINPVTNMSVNISKEEEAEIYITEDTSNSLAGTSVFIPADTSSQDFILSVKTCEQSIISGNSIPINSNHLILEPSGLQFQKPIIVSMKYIDTIDPDSILIERFSNNVIDYIEPIHVDLETKTLVFETYHFSNYQITKKSKLINELTYIDDLIKMFDEYEVEGFQDINSTPLITFLQVNLFGMDCNNKRINSNNKDLKFNDLCRYFLTLDKAKKLIKKNNFYEANKHLVKYSPTMKTLTFLADWSLATNTSSSLITEYFTGFKVAGSFVSRVVGTSLQGVSAYNKYNKELINNQVGKFYSIDNYLKDRDNYTNNINDVIYSLNSTLNSNVHQDFYEPFPFVAFNGWFSLGGSKPDQKIDNKYWKNILSLKHEIDALKVKLQAIKFIKGSLENSLIFATTNVVKEGTKVDKVEVDELVDINLTISSNTNNIPFQLMGSIDLLDNNYKISRKSMRVQEKEPQLYYHYLFKNIKMPSNEGILNYFIRYRLADCNSYNKVQGKVDLYNPENQMKLKDIRIKKTKRPSSGNYTITAVPVVYKAGNILSHEENMYKYNYTLYKNDNIVTVEKDNKTVKIEDSNTTGTIRIFLSEDTLNKFGMNNYRLCVTLLQKDNNDNTYLEKRFDLDKGLSNEDLITLKVIKINDNQVDNTSHYYINDGDKVTLHLEPTNNIEKIMLHDLDGNLKYKVSQLKVQSEYDVTINYSAPYTRKPRIKIQTLAGDKLKITSQDKIIVRKDGMKAVSLKKSIGEDKKRKSKFSNFERGKTYTANITLENISINTLYGLELHRISDGLIKDDIELGDLQLGETKTYHFDITIPSDSSTKNYKQYFKIVDIDGDTVESDTVYYYNISIIEDPITIIKNIPDQTIAAGESLYIDLSEFVESIYNYSVTTSKGEVNNNIWTINESNQGIYQVNISVISEDDKKELFFQLFINGVDSCIFFDDIANLSHVEKEVINTFSCNSIINGNNKKLYPYENIKGFEFFKIALRRFYNEDFITLGINFDDLESTNPAYKYYATAYEKDFIQTKTTNWNNYIKSGDACLLLQNILNDKYDSLNYSTDNVDTDILNIFSSHEDSYLTRISVIMGINELYDNPFQYNPLKADIKLSSNNIDKGKSIQLSIEIVSGLNESATAYIDWGDSQSTGGIGDGVSNSSTFNYVYKNSGYYELLIKIIGFFSGKTFYTSRFITVNNSTVDLEKITNSIGMTFVKIPSGAFMMGTQEDDLFHGMATEPLRQVTISQDFYMQTTEVTQGQWMAIMDNNPSYFLDCGDDCPVENVSRSEALEFIQKLNLKENTTTYRLPTDEEWEYAARAGNTTSLSNGNLLVGDCNLDTNLDAMGWYCGNTDKTQPVAQKQANIWGLYDMHGNVCELCNDLVDSYVFDSLKKRPLIRGGAWNFPASDCRSMVRFASPINEGIYKANIGLRVLKTL